MGKGALALSLLGLLVVPGCGPSSASPSPTPSPSPSVRAFAPGGSNYVMYSVGDYASHPTDDIWRRDVRPVIGTFHLDPGRVERQLQTMFANGQRRLSLVLWFVDLSRYAGLGDDERYAHGVNSRLGRLLPQHEANLRTLLGLIRKDGYEEIVFRFASQAGSAPWEWTAWDEAAYQKNLAFIVSTRAIVEDVLGHGPVAVTYDLDVELAGRFDGQSSPYLVRLWRDYTMRFGTERTMAFSMIANPGRMAQFIQQLDEGGARPDEYGVDVYGNEGARLTAVDDELRAANEGDKPLIVLEVYYNDAATASEIRRARPSLPNMRTLFQWPDQRGTSGPDHWVQYPEEFDRYSGLLP